MIVCRKWGVLATEKKYNTASIYTVQYLQTFSGNTIRNENIRSRPGKPNQWKGQN